MKTTNKLNTIISTVVSALLFIIVIFVAKDLYSKTYYDARVQLDKYGVVIYERHDGNLYVSLDYEITDCNDKDLPEGSLDFLQQLTEMESLPDPGNRSIYRFDIMNNKKYHMFTYNIFVKSKDLSDEVPPKKWEFITYICSGKSKQWYEYMSSNDLSINVYINIIDVSDNNRLMLSCNNGNITYDKFNND